MKPSQIIVAKSDAVRADFRRRIEMVHTFNEHRKCADFVLIHNMAWYLVNTMDYYARSTMADALADCKEALLLFDNEKSDDGDVSAGTLIRVAVTLTKLAEMLLHVKHAHYCRAADAAYDFSQRSFANAQAKNGSADSHKPRKAISQLCGRIDAKLCRRHARLRSGRSGANSGGNPGANSGSA